MNFKNYATRIGTILSVTLLSLINYNLTFAQGAGDGWVDPASIATPVTGDISEGVVSAIGPQATADNVRLNAMVVYDYYSNTTFGTYLGGDEATAGIYVISYNHTTQTQSEARAVYLFSEHDSRWDTHSYPTIVKSLDGYIHIFFADMLDSHKTLHIRFHERGTVESDYTLAELPHGRSFYGRDSANYIRSVYSAPFVSRNGDIYYFAHYNPYNSYEMSVTYNGSSYTQACRPEIYIKSTDGGLTWEPIKIGLLRRNSEDFLTEPYVTQIVPEPQREGVEERIRITWTLAAGIGLWFDAEGNLRHNYHNAHSKNLYHAYFVPGEDNFYSVDGTNLGESIIDEEMDNYCLAHQTLDEYYPLPMTTEQYAIMTSNKTSIMGNFAAVDNNGDVTLNFNKHWNGSAWENIDTETPADTRLMDYKNGRYYAYNGFNNYYKENLDDPWTTIGSFIPELSSSVVGDRLGSVGMKRSCPPARQSHPEAQFWVKAVLSGEQFGGFALLAGHRTSYVPSRVAVEAERGRVYPGGEVNINAYIIDEYGARIMDANNTINFSSTIGTFTSTTTEAYQGLGKTVMTINSGVTPGEYAIEASSSGLTVGTVYVTVHSADEEEPTVPTNLIATVVSDSQIDLNWNPATDDNAVVGYRIYRNGIETGTTSGVNFSDEGLDALTTYNYTVAAYDGGGNISVQSSPVSATTNEAQTSVEIPFVLSNIGVSSSHVSLSWSEPNNEEIAGYYLYRNGVFVIETDEVSYSDEGLNASSSYTYSVEAVDALGNEIQVTDLLTVSTLSDGFILGIPINFSAQAMSMNRIDLTWSAPDNSDGIVGYNIYRDGYFLTSCIGTRFSDLGLRPSTKHTYTITSFTEDGIESSVTEMVEATTHSPQSLKSNSTKEIKLVNYPNPFSTETQIAFVLPESDYINLSVYDMQGNLVEVLANEYRYAGSHVIQYNANNIVPGVYYTILKTKEIHQMNRMLHINQ